MLKELYDQNQKPAMPDDSQYKTLDLSTNNAENVGSNSNNEILCDGWVFNEKCVDTLTAEEAPVMETLLADLRAG